MPKLGPAPEKSEPPSVRGYQVEHSRSGEVCGASVTVEFEHGTFNHRTKTTVHFSRNTSSGSWSLARVEDMGDMDLSSAVEVAVVAEAHLHEQVPDHIPTDDTPAADAIREGFEDHYLPLFGDVVYVHGRSE